MRREIKLAFASAAATAVVCFAAGEIWLRANKPYMTPASERATSLEYEASLFSRNVLPRKRRIVRNGHNELKFAINDLGYRGQSFDIPKPPGVTRVVILGGSAAFDIYAKEGEDWPRLVEENLHRAGHLNVEVVNAATPGHATWDILGRLYSEIWMFDPDYIVVYEAWNDIKYFTWLDPSRPLLRGYRPPPTVDDKSALVENPFIYYTGPVDRLLSYSQLYTRVRRRFWWWWLGQMGLEGLIAGPGEAVAKTESYPDTYEPWGVDQYELDLRLIAEAARAIGAQPIYITQARLPAADSPPGDRARIRYDYVHLTHDGVVRAFADCDRATYRAAAIEGVQVLDLARQFSGRSDLFTDHVHLSSKGSEAIAAAVTQFLQGFFAERPMRSYAPRANAFS